MSLPAPGGPNPAATPVPASLSVFGAEPTAATATVLEQGPGQRAGRALAGLGMFWGAAAAAVFIPVAHWFLVPGLLLCGIAVAALRLREERRLLGVRGTCPRCRVEQDFPASGRFGGERDVVCPRCHARLRVASA